MIGALGTHPHPRWTGRRQRHPIGAALCSSGGRHQERSGICVPRRELVVATRRTRRTAPGTAHDVRQPGHDARSPQSPRASSPGFTLAALLVVAVVVDPFSSTGRHRRRPPAGPGASAIASSRQTAGEAQLHARAWSSQRRSARSRSSAWRCTSSTSSRRFGSGSSARSDGSKRSPNASNGSEGSSRRCTPGSPTSH